MSVSSKLRKARRLSWRDWRILLAALLWLPVVQIVLQARGLKPAQRLLNSPVLDRRRTADSEEATTRRVVNLVDAACRHHFKRFNCLPRSLVLQRLLARQGIASELRIGVDMDGGTLTGHAWLEHNGKAVGEDAGVEEQFSVLKGGGAVRP